MSNWPDSPSWSDPKTINAGNQYNAADGVLYTDMNKIISNLLYLKQRGGIIPTGTLSIVSNDTYDVTKYARVEVNVPQTGGGNQPQLNAPTISLSNSTLSIVNPTTNGDFVNSYKIYSDDAIVATIAENQIDLDTLQLSVGTHVIKVTAGGTNFESSPFSNEVTYEVAAATINGQYKWNAVLTSATAVQPVNFVSNGKTYESIRVADNMLYYDETVVYNNGWVDDKYRLVNFGDAPQTITSIFEKYVTTNAYKLTKLETPSNIEVDNSTVSFEADERATQFELVVNGTSWGNYSPQTQQ